MPTDEEAGHVLRAREAREARMPDEEAGHMLRAREVYDARKPPDIIFKPSMPEVHEGWTITGPGVLPLGGRVKMTSGFGGREPPIEGASSWHGALDFGAKLGSPVYSMRSGKVLFAGPSGGHGNRVVVRFHDGTTVAYSHLQSIGVKPGQWVVMGQAVGAVGSTGVSTGAHLHLEAAAPGKNIMRAKERGNPKDILSEFAHLGGRGWYDFGEAPTERASEEEVDELSRRFKDMWRRWVSEGKPESMSQEFNETYYALESVGVDPVDAADTVRDYGQPQTPAVDADEKTLVESMFQ